MNNIGIKSGVRLRDVANAASVSSDTVAAIVNGRASKFDFLSGINFELC